MTIVLWIAAGLFGALCAFLTFINGAILVQGAILKQETPSWVPLMGGLSGVVALLLCPLAGTARWWWVPLVLDYGSLPGALHTAWYYWRHRNDPEEDEELS
jgi:hypothetical protein